MKTCPVCDGPAVFVWGDLYDDRYGRPGTYPLLACRQCGHKFLDVSFTEEELGSLYSDYYPRGERDLEDFTPAVEVRGFRAWFDGEFASAFRWVPRNVRVLDVGCGFGESLAYHQARGCEAHGVDLDDNLRRVAERYGLNARVGAFRADDYGVASFDVVTLDQVVEHSIDPRALFRDVAAVLRPGGTAIIATPNSHGYGRLLGRRWMNWHAPYHLQQFSRGSLRRVAEDAGMAVVLTRTVTNSQWLHWQWIHAFTRPPEGIPSPFWDPQRSSLSRRRVPMKVGGLLARARVFHVLTRIADRLGQGDNLLCVLKKT